MGWEATFLSLEFMALRATSCLIGRWHLVAAIHATLAEWRRSQLTTASGLTLPRLESRASQSSFDGDTSKIKPKFAFAFHENTSEL